MLYRTNTNRPTLRELLEDVKQKKIDIILVYKIDRLTRSPKNFYQLIEIFEKYNINFISITEKFDTSTPADRLLRNIRYTSVNKKGWRACSIKEVLVKRIENYILENLERISLDKNYIENLVFRLNQPAFRRGGNSVR